MPAWMVNKKGTFRVILAVSMVAAGVLHFIVPAQFIKIVPGFLPFPAALVYISGVIEILLGIGLLIPPVSRLSAMGLMALFISVYPANINMAVNMIHIDGLPDQNWWFHAFRLPFQFVLIAWAYWLARPERSRQDPRTGRPAVEGQ